MNVVSLHAAKTHLSRLVDDAAKGEDVVIAKAGRPIVRLVPVSNESRRRGFGSMTGKIRIGKNFDDPLPDDLARAWREGVKLLLGTNVLLWWMASSTKLGSIACWSPSTINPGER
jgi:prevent-host-death family protein